MVYWLIRTAVVLFLSLLDGLLTPPYEITTVYQRQRGELAICPYVIATGLTVNWWDSKSSKIATARWISKSPFVMSVVAGHVTHIFPAINPNGLSLSSVKDHWYITGKTVLIVEHPDENLAPGLTMYLGGLQLRKRIDNMYNYLSGRMALIKYAWPTSTADDNRFCVIIVSYFPYGRRFEEKYRRFHQVLIIRLKLHN